MRSLQFIGNSRASVNCSTHLFALLGIFAGARLPKKMIKTNKMDLAWYGWFIGLLSGLFLGIGIISENISVELSGFFFAIAFTAALFYIVKTKIEITNSSGGNQ